MADEKDEFRVIDRRGQKDAESAKADEGKGPGFTMKEPPAPPQLDFSTLILSLATGALIQLGLTPDPTTRKVVKNLELARQNIDILDMLKAKTKGNLTTEESQLLENLLTEVRLRFVEASKS